MRSPPRVVIAVVLAALGVWGIIYRLRRDGGESAAPERVTSAAGAPLPDQQPAPKARISTLARGEDAALGAETQPGTGDPRRYEENVPSAVSVLLDPEADDTARNEAANLLRRWGHEDLTDNLTEVLKDPQENPRFRSFCIQHLWQNSDSAEPEELDKITRALRVSLEDRELAVRREALLALVRMNDPKGRETAIRWLMDEEGNGTRDLAIRCAHELGLKEHIPLIREYAQKPNTVVQVAAIVALSQWGDEESRPVFEEAAKSRIVRLQRAGEAALKRLDERKQE